MARISVIFIFKNQRFEFFRCLLLGNIKSFFGGQIKSYDKVLAYGRAEVLQRLREQALGEGWTEIINVRIETSMVMNKVKGGQQNKIGTLEFLAFGTGIR